MTINENDCPCPGSYWDAGTPPVDMETWAVSGPDGVQSLQYYESKFETLYNIECGVYSIRFNPAYAWLSIAISGLNTSPNGGYTYPDTITASTNDPNDAGVWSVDMIIYQDGTGNS